MGRPPLPRRFCARCHKPLYSQMSIAKLICPKCDDMKRRKSLWRF